MKRGSYKPPAQLSTLERTHPPRSAFSRCSPAPGTWAAAGKHKKNPHSQGLSREAPQDLPGPRDPGWAEAADSHQEPPQLSPGNEGLR